MSGIGDVVRSLAFYLAFYTGTVWYVLAAVATMASGGARFDRAIRGWSRFHRICVERLLGIRVVIEGELPRSHVLIAMRHESFFEAIDLPNMLDHPAVIAKAELLRIPMWGKAARAYGLIGVERDQGANALRVMLKQARALIEAGRVLVIFPEGTRVAHGHPAPLGAGFAGLYKLLRLPVVPIAVNSGPLYQRRWKRRGVITVRVGEPIPTGLDRETLEARVTAAICALNPPAPPAPTGSS